MAISQNFLTGRMRKSAGGTRFSTWRGLNVVASKPMEVRQNVTPAVKLNRSKLSVVGKGVSKLNIVVNELYSLGIAKTTPFADTVRVFRSAMTDSLKLDAAKLSGISFGTGNVADCSFSVDDDSAASFSIVSNAFVQAFGNDMVESTLIVFNDSFTKFHTMKFSSMQDNSISASLTSSGFVAGDKVGFCVKRVQYKPGADLSGKVKMFSETGFISLT